MITGYDGKPLNHPSTPEEIRRCRRQRYTNALWCFVVAPVGWLGLAALTVATLPVTAPIMVWVELDKRRRCAASRR